MAHWALEQHPAVEAQRNVLHAVFTEALLNVPEQRLTRQIRIASKRSSAADSRIGCRGIHIMGAGPDARISEMLTGSVRSGESVRTGAGVSRLPFSSPKALLICSTTAQLSTFPTTISVIASGCTISDERFYLFGIDRLFQRLLPNRAQAALSASGDNATSLFASAGVATISLLLSA